MLQGHSLEDKAMQSRHFRKAVAALIVALFAVTAAPVSASAASAFEGTWKVQDTKGQPFEITLSADGTAKGDRAGEGLTGKWTANEKRAVIKWDTGWTTKIVKTGDTYQKRAYEKEPAKGKPTHASEAEKVQ
jgi:uncharacterized lipoprotein NlpE involved in copper resistance